MAWILVCLLVVVIAALVWVVLRNRPEKVLAPVPSKPSTPGKPAPKAEPATWGKTVVVPDPANACPAVLKIQGQSFANDEAPRLPLTSCGIANCRCHYVPSKEQRSGKERRSGKDRRADLRFEPGKPGDRRSGKDRRHRKGYDWDSTI